MTVDFKAKFKALYEKIKKVKHIEIYLSIGLALVVALAYFAFIVPKKKTKSEVPNVDNVSTTFSNSNEYIEYLENKLENVITRVKGVGDTEVIITLEKGFEYVYVTEDEMRTTSNGINITSSSVVMVDGKPVIKEEIYPVVKGIVVIATGVNDVGVKMNIISIIQTVIDVDNSKISIFEGKN